MNAMGSKRATNPSKNEAKQDLIASSEMLQVFHCNICNCLLSVPPIRLVENAYVCGRCPGEGLRQVPLEKFASIFKFPCRYVQEGCKLDLIWSEIKKHEQICCYQLATCTIPKCGWKGTRTSLVQHFETVHESQVLGEKDSIKLSNVILAKYFCFIGDDAAFEIEIEYSEELKLVTYKVTELWSKLGSSSYAYKVTFLDEEVQLNLFHQAKALGVLQHVETKTIKSLMENFDQVQMHFKIDVSEHIKYTYDVCANCSSPLLKNTYVANCGHGICETCATADKYSCPICSSKRAPCNDQNERAFIKNHSLDKIMDSFNYNLK